MYAIKTQFDGKKIKVPKELRNMPPAEVIVIFPDSPNGEEEKEAWMKQQEDAFAKVWNNDEDSVYDNL